jgi:hypothetical protein
MAEKPENLLDLFDDVLIKIFSYLDHKFQLKTMLVCRRLDQLIGQNVQFYKNHKLSIDRKSTLLNLTQNRNRNRKITKTEDKFMYFGRYFGEIRLYDYIFGSGSKYFPTLRENLETIGANVIKLEIEFSYGYKDPLQYVLQLTDNVKELIIDRVTIYPNQKHSSTNIKVDLQKCKFPNLRRLDLISIQDFEMIEEVFHPVDSLHHLKLVNIQAEEWGVYQQLLARQTNLLTLELDRVAIDSFEYKEWNIEKLSLKNIEFTTKEALESFDRFIKTLTNVKDLELDFVAVEKANQNNYRELLVHLLNLKTLSKLKLSFREADSFISTLPIRNPSVTMCVIDREITNYYNVYRWFPNIQSLCFAGWPNGNGSFSALSSLKSLKELEFDGLHQQILPLIKCPTLKKFSVETTDYVYRLDPSIYKTFVENNPNIEHLKNINDSNFLTYLISNLPQLKILDLSKTSTHKSSQLVKLIGEKCGNLEHLEMQLSFREAKEAASYFKTKFPHLRSDLKQLRSGRYKNNYTYILKVTKI